MRFWIFQQNDIPDQCHQQILFGFCPEIRFFKLVGRCGDDGIGNDINKAGVLFDVGQAIEAVAVRRVQQIEGPHKKAALSGAVGRLLKQVLR